MGCPSVVSPSSTGLGASWRGSSGPFSASRSSTAPWQPSRGGHPAREKASSRKMGSSRGRAHPAAWGRPRSVGLNRDAATELPAASPVWLAPGPLACGRLPAVESPKVAGCVGAAAAGNAVETWGSTLHLRSTQQTALSLPHWSHCRHGVVRYHAGRRFRIPPLRPPHAKQLLAISSLEPLHHPKPVLSSRTWHPS